MLIQNLLSWYLLSDQNLDYYSIKDVFYWILPFYLIQFYFALSGRYRLPNPPFTQMPLARTWHDLLGPLMWMNYVNWMWIVTENLWSQPGVVCKLCGLVDNCLEGFLVLKVMWLWFDLIFILVYWAFGQQAFIAAIRRVTHL